MIIRHVRRRASCLSPYAIQNTKYTLPITYLIPILLLCLYFVLTGWGNVTLAQSPITAEVDRTTVSTNEELLLTVTVRGELASIPRPDLSGVQDFAVVSSGSSTQISWINGELTSQGIFRFHLRPLQEGNLTIAPIGVTIDGQLYQTAPIDIEVVPGVSPNVPSATPLPGQAPAALADQPLFVEAEVDNPVPYLGEQITYIFRFYQAADAAVPTFGRPDYRPPPFTNFWGQTVLSQPYYSTTINGRDYLVTEIHTALFPANPGSLTIDPTQLIILGDLFNSDIRLETEPVVVEVQSLPTGAPPDFNGAVGQFEIKTRLSATEGIVNEPLTLYLDLEGQGNVELLTEPPLPNLPNWRVFDSQSSSKVEAQEDVVYGRRRFERLLVPGQPGEYTFPAIRFSYFDPQAGDYRTIESEPIPIIIHPGETTDYPPVVVDSDKQPVQVITGDIRHIKPVPTALDGAGGLLISHPLYWTFWILPVLVVGGVWIWQNRRQRLLLDSAYARSQRARRVAHKILAGARQPDADGCAVAQRALLGYLSDKLNQPTVGLTTDNLIELLRQHQFDPSLIERVETVLTKIDAGRFAPIEEIAVQSLVVETRNLVNDLEKSFGGPR
ncbi:MAG: protein BatD [Anaerolineae bacterium]|nr:protein BatD [Anaerolineae bacterium]